MAAGRKGPVLDEWCSRGRVLLSKRRGETLSARIVFVKLTALTDLMDAQAEFTWHALIEARELEADFGEVTATQINLMAIQRLVRATGLPLRVQRISQNVEKRVGADWEFWIVL